MTLSSAHQGNIFHHDQGGFSDGREPARRLGRLCRCCHEQHGPDCALAMSIRIFGRLQPSLLEEALGDLVSRHEALRPVCRNDAVPPREERLQEYKGPELHVVRGGETAFGEAVFRAKQRMVSIPAALPFSPTLYSISETAHVLLILIRECIFDAWSAEPLAADLFKCYSARLEGRPPAVRDLTAIGAGQSVQQKPLLQPCARRECGKFNDAGRLNDEPHRDRRQCSFRRFTACCDKGEKTVVPVRLNAAIHRRLLAVAGDRGVAPEIIWQAAVASTLMQMTGGGLVLGLMRSGRGDAHLRHLIGRFATTLTIQIPAGADPDLQRMIPLVAECYAGAGPHTRCPCITFAGIGYSADAVLPALAMKCSGASNIIAAAGIRAIIDPVPARLRGFNLLFDFDARFSPDNAPQGIEGNLICRSGIFSPGFMVDLMDRIVGLIKTARYDCNGDSEKSAAGGKDAEWLLQAIAPGSTCSAFSIAPVLRVAAIHREDRRIMLPAGASVAAAGAGAVAAGPEWQQRYVPPRDSLQCRLAGIWEELLGVSRIGVRDLFADAGGTEAAGHGLMQSIEREFGISLPKRLFCGAMTVESLAGVLLGEAPVEPFVVLQTGEPDRIPLVFVHGDVFGGGLYTRALSLRLRPEQPFYVFPPHGLNGHELPASIEMMAQDNRERLLRQGPPPPYCLGGHCNGALVAYEMARLLEADGISVPLVIMIDIPYVDFSRNPDENDPPPARRPSVPAGSPAHRAWVLRELFRVSWNYRPAPYSGKVFYLQAQDNFYGKQDIYPLWKLKALNMEHRIIAGDHVSCIGRHVADLALHLNALLFPFTSSLPTGVCHD
ncbi:MAG TPA: condensation domain-containing protein [Acidobacteriota bacterium]|nr:condensation domain-containing protein [Acidobacteriota bacterium]